MPVGTSVGTYFSRRHVCLPAAQSDHIPLPPRCILTFPHAMTNGSRTVLYQRAMCERKLLRRDVTTYRSKPEAAPWAWFV
ncbi:predicted protein [Pyrenophora tritici-repentis Pt-1C-BFP]|uniref:Uncharacterized protein n=1 Tax=Pyrenophora tritici-repentis (strain Pt-1C-BFP) TaxID=426418 RepID=B2W2D5_PYRTR|nr:uncharacterized protein PTRG_03583 [Pyrenophora tritici-repentis Pt-1C-BFP]EDU46421.1 predicted protein [Pyrenophora tritici-repentis Pt-1C-BFP]